MFNRTTLGKVSPVLPIDFLGPAGKSERSPVCKLVAPRTRILLRDFPRATDFQLQDGCIALFQSLGVGFHAELSRLGA
jgi:CRP/FNR family transcriptional regulator, anaerobic regulatory protein